MSRHRHRPRPACGALIVLAGLLAAAPLSAAPEAVSVTPQQAQRGTAVTLEVGIRDWQPGAQLALLPGGPFVSHRLDLPATPRAITSDGRRAWVASDGGWLQAIAFPAGAAARVVARRKIDEGGIHLLRLAHGQLLAAVEGHGVMLFDVTLPTQILHQWTYRSGLPVTDMQLGENEAWLLLGGRRLEHLRFDEFTPAEAVQHWQLPMEASGFVIKGDTALTVGADGLASLDLGTPGATVRDRQAVGGRPSRVLLAAGLALVDAGPAGLQVFDAADPGRLRWLGSNAKRGAIDGLSVSADRAWVGSGGQTVQGIALGNPELPATGPALRLDAPLVGLSGRGETVFAATTRGVQRLDFATPAVADISPEGVNLGGSRRGVIRDDILYVADWFSGLHLYDVRDPANPRHLGNYHTPGSSKGVALYGRYALVGDDDYGLQIIDVADPRRPRWVAELNWTSKESTLGLAYTMKVVGDTLYLADHRGGFQIIDLSDIEHPRILGALDTPGKSWAVDVSGHTAFVADDDDGLLIVDVGDPAAIRLLGRFNPGGHAEDVVVRDGLAYLAFFDNGLFIVDVGDPARPRPLAHLAIPGNARGIALEGDLAYVSGWESGLQVVDVGDPRAPRIVGHYDTDGAVWGTVVQGGTAYALDWWGGIKVLDVSDPARPAYLTRYQGRGTLHRLRRAGHYIFAASGAGGIQVFDIRNPLNPIWAGGADLPGEALDLWLEDGHAYVAAGDGGVAVIDTEDPFYTRTVGRLDTPGQARLIRARDDYLFIADQRAGLLVADARDPARPRLISQRPLPIDDLWVDEAGLYLAGPDGLRWLTVDEAGRLSPAAQLDASGVGKVRGQDGLLAIALADDTLQLLRRGADGLTPLGRFDVGEAVLDLQLDGRRLFVLGARTGLLEVDIRDPMAPRLGAIYPATGRHRNLLLADGAAFLGGERRLASTTLLPPVHFGEVAGDTIPLRLPEGMPAGRYHLLAIGADGQRQLLPNAFELSFGAPGKQRFNLETMRRLMKKPPAGD